MNSKVEAARNGRRTQINRPEYQALRDVLAEAMEQRGLGQREVSRKLDKPFVYVNRILQARRTLEFAELLDLCEAIGADPAELIATALNRTAKQRSGAAS